MLAMQGTYGKKGLTGMALGALIGAYQEDESGGLRALLPLAGHTLLEYQARCLAAIGAAPIVVLVERMPPAINEAIERLRGEGIGVIAVSDGVEAASRFEAGSDVMLLADGVAADMTDVADLADQESSAILTVPDDDDHAGFERIDGGRRWAGLARIESSLLGATAAMLGDWDLQSTLLRRAIQAGVPLKAATSGEGAGPLLAEDEAALANFERRLLVASRGARDDWVARYLLPVVEEVATERLMETRIAPSWLVNGAIGLSVAAAFSFTRGWLGPGLALLVLALPLDLVARRIGLLRLRPLSPRSTSWRLLWPAAGLALMALGWFVSRNGGGWGAMVAALAAAGFAEALRLERGSADLPGKLWLFSRRSAIMAAIPFALFGAWNSYLAIIALYAATSFFLVQHVRHRDSAQRD
jgi:hypothetical protein